LTTVVLAFSAINGITAMQSDRPKAGQKLLFEEVWSEATA
jgi:hypothetical protein